MFKVSEVIFVQKVYRFKKLFVANLFRSFPDGEKVALYIPEVSAIHKLDKTYALNVSLKGTQHS